MKKSPFIIIILLVIAVVAAFFLMKEKGTRKESSTITQQTESPCVTMVAADAPEDGWREVSLCQSHADGSISKHTVFFPVAYFPSPFTVEATDEYNKPAVFLDGVWKITLPNDYSRLLYRIHEDILITTIDTPADTDDVLVIDSFMKTTQVITLGDVDMSAFTYDATNNRVGFTTFDGTVHTMSITGAPGEGSQLLPVIE